MDANISEKEKIKNLRQKNKICNVIVGVLSFLFIGLIMFSLMNYTGPVRSCEIDPDSQIITLNLGEAALSDCKIDSNNQIVYTGENPKATFDIDLSEKKSLKINFSQNIDKNIFTHIHFFNTNNQENIEASNYLSYFQDSYLCYDLSEKNINSFTVDLLNCPQISSFDISNAQPVPKIVYLDFSWKWNIIGLVLTIIITALIVVIQAKTHFAQKFVAFISIRKKYLLFCCVTVIFSFFVGIAIEFIILLLFSSVLPTGDTFNVYWAIAIAVITEFVIVSVYYAKRKTIKVQNMFLALALCLGLAYIFCVPFEHIHWDEDPHYSFCVGVASRQDYLTEADQEITKVKDHQIFFENNLGKEYLNVDYLNNANNEAVNKTTWHPELAHLPGTIVISLSRILGIPFYWQCQLIVVVNYLIYVICCYFGIKTLKSRKILFSVFAFIPTCLFLASSYSYDGWMIAFVVLGMGLFIGEFQKTEQCVSNKKVLAMCTCFLLACIPKPVYIPIMLIPLLLFFRGFSSKKDKRKFYSIVFLSVIILLLYLLLRSYIVIIKGGELRGGESVSTFGQIMFILQNPLLYAKIFFNYLFNYLSLQNAATYICSLGYMNYGPLGSIICSVYVVLLVLCCIVDVPDKSIIKNCVIAKIFVCILAFITVILIVTALYVSFNPVGSTNIEGCQGRYLLPILIPVLAILWPTKISNKYNSKNFSYCILLTSSALSLLQLLSVSLPYLS